MSKEYKLDLYHNAIDSLNESIKYYKVSIDDESKYKFCIILLSHFMELLLKFLVESQNPLLCFERPYSDKINKEKTISWNQALQILRNSRIEIDNDVCKHLTRLVEIRNSIVHYIFDYNTSEIRNIMLNIVSDMRELFILVKNSDFYNDVDDLTRQLLSQIESEYKKDLHLAQAEAKEEADGEDIYDCEICGEEQTVNLVDGVYKCQFCKEKDESEECVRCGQEFRVSQLIKYGETEEGYPIYMCEWCNDEIEKD